MSVRDGEYLLTSRQAARYLGIDFRTLKNYPIPYNKVGVKGWRRYEIADLEAWRERTRVTPATESELRAMWGDR
jgi:hypothetical protein